MIAVARWTVTGFHRARTVSTMSEPTRIVLATVGLAAVATLALVAAYIV